MAPPHSIRLTPRALQLAICLPPLAIVLVAFAILTASPGTVWDEETWGRPSRSSYCEPPQNSAVIQPINAWSNLGYVLLGVWSWSAGARDIWRLWHPSSEPAPPFTIAACPEFSFVCGASWVGLGMCSFLFHASLVRTWQKWDVGFTCSAGATLLAWSACSVCLHHLPPCRRWVRLTRACCSTLAIISMVLLVHLKWEYSATTMLIYIISALILIELILLPMLEPRSRRSRASAGCAVLCMGAAYVVRQLEADRSWGRCEPARTCPQERRAHTARLMSPRPSCCIRPWHTQGHVKPVAARASPPFAVRVRYTSANSPPTPRPWCFYSSWFQPHAVWHGMTAVAIGLLYYSWRLPLPHGPTERRWHCCPIRVALQAKHSHLTDATATVTNSELELQP